MKEELLVNLYAGFEYYERHIMKYHACPSIYDIKEWEKFKEILFESIREDCKKYEPIKREPVTDNRDIQKYTGGRGTSGPANYIY